MCPRISANDFLHLLQNKADAYIALDLRNVLDYARVHVPNSLNIPFNTVQFGEQRLDALSIPQLEEMLQDRIVICVSNIHENAVEVSIYSLVNQ